MVAVLLGLLIAASFGSGDYVGGRASRSTSTVAVLVVAQVCAVVGALALAAVVPGDLTARDLVLGAAAGTVNVAGLGLLYDGLGRHAAAVIAPVTAVVGSSVPVTWGLVRGERPPALVLVGAAVAIAAGGLISLELDDTARIRFAAGAVQAGLAGVTLGSSLVLFSETSDQSGQWPVASARVAAFVAVAVTAVVLSRRGTVRLPRGTARSLAIGAGVFDVIATAILVYAVRRELLVVVAPVASLAPAFTVVLARLIDDERFRRVQAVGLLCALVGMALIATH